MLPILAALLLQTATPAAPPSVPTPAAVGAPSSDPVVCQKITPTGTRFSKKVCAPQSQWNALSSESRANTEGMQSHRDWAPKG